MKEYYKICLRHAGKNDNTFLFWGSNASGYQRNLEEADLNEADDTKFDTQVKRGDFLVHKDFIEKYKQLVRLPKYGEKEETYAGRNEFYVLPNTGQIRKELCITSVDFSLDGDRNSFDAYFKDTCSETFKTVKSKTHFNVKGKQEYFDEWWYCDTEVEASNRDKAIYDVFKSGDFGISHYDVSFIEFKKMVTCSRTKTTVFNKWVESK